jgi:hypothetical protein
VGRRARRRQGQGDEFRKKEVEIEELGEGIRRNAAGRGNSGVE